MRARVFFQRLLTYSFLLVTAGIAGLEDAIILSRLQLTDYGLNPKIPELRTRIPKAGIVGGITLWLDRSRAQ